MMSLVKRHQMFINLTHLKLKVMKLFVTDQHPFNIIYDDTVSFNTVYHVTKTEIPTNNLNGLLDRNSTSYS